MKKQTLSIIQKQELGIKELGYLMAVPEKEIQADSLFFAVDFDTVAEVWKVFDILKEEDYTNTTLTFLRRLRKSI